MWATFTEAVRAVPDPCTRALVGISIVAIVLARHRLAALGGVIAATIVGGWNLAAGWLVFDRSWNWVAYILAVVSLVAIVAWRRRESAAAIGAAGAVFASTLWWIPCVGPEFGAVLSDASRSGIGPVLGPLTIYLLGLTVPAVVVTGIAELISRQVHVARSAVPAVDAS